VTACNGKQEAELCMLANSDLARCYDGVCVDAGCGNSARRCREICDDGNSVVGDIARRNASPPEVCGNQIMIRS
jgi:hypothetical protein